MIPSLMALSTRTVKMLNPTLLAAKAGQVSGLRPNPVRIDREDQAFLEVFSEARQRTLVDRQRAFMLYQLARQALAIEGDFAEVGVYKGGTARLLAQLAEGTNKRLELFDTFEGMPETDSTKDHHQAGDFADTSLEGVKRFVGGGELISFHQGIFPETASAVADRRFSLAHIDVDIYSSVFDSCEFFYPRLSPAGILIFDDYGFRSCPGAREAVDEFFSTRDEAPIYLLTGQAFVIKV